jgi:hypothetical protein
VHLILEARTLWKEINLSEGKKMKMMKRFEELTGLIIMVVAFFLPSFPVFAARPLTTDDASTVEKGKFQVEMGFDAAHQDNRDREYKPSLTLSYGLSEKADIGIGSAYLFVHPQEGGNQDGLGDTEAKVKYRLMEEEEKGWRPAFSIAGKLKAPTASESKGLGSGKADYGVNAIVTKNLSKRWVLHVNMGYTFIGGEGASNEMNYSLSAQLIVSDKWALVGEVVGVNNFNGRGEDDPFSALVGAYYQINDNFVWDIGFAKGMNSAAPDFRITTGLTFFFKP